MSISLVCSDSKKKKQVEEILAPFKLSNSTLKKIRDVFEKEMALGMEKNPSQKSSLQMENTFITQLCNGNETGEFLALDLGGTNFRVMLVKIEPEKGIYDLIKYYDIPENLYIGHGDKLFDFLATCIYEFAKENDLLDRKLSLGFCFSFPMTQKAVNVGILVTWTKSFNCPDVVGKDAVAMLNSALERRGDLLIDVSVVVNDTTGTLLNGAYVRQDCRIGLILGTGCNACYMEKIQNIEKWEGDESKAKEVIIDIEWGAFGDNGVLDFMKTEYDALVDEHSLLPHSFTFEKLFAGKYLGEIVRRVLLKLIHCKVLFDGKLSSRIDVLNCFTTSHVSDILKNTGATRTKEIFTQLGYDASDNEINIVKYVCCVVSERGAALVSMCLSSLLDKMDQDFISIAVNGTLYRHHPYFDSTMRAYINKFSKKEFDLFLVHDGSGIGAGLAAAIVQEL